MLKLGNSFRVALVAALVTSLTLPTPLVGAILINIDELTATDENNHRMEEAIVIGDTIFENAAVDDYAQVNLTNGSGGHGDTIRAYLLEGGRYTVATSRRIDSNGNNASSSSTLVDIDDTVLSVVGGSAGGVGVEDARGLSTAAAGLDFDYAGNGYGVIFSDDDGHSVPNFSSKAELNVTQSGYFYFYVSMWNGGSASTVADEVRGYNTTNPGEQIDANGSMHFVGSGDITATGVVTGGLGSDVGNTARLFINVSQAASSPGSGNATVPEPASAAIFALLAVGACCSLRSKRRKQRHPE